MRNWVSSGSRTCSLHLDYEAKSRDFKEALELTAQAKLNFKFNKDDLLRRGRRLIRESVECGVTSMRAHVEVDTYVEMACLEVALSPTEAILRY